MAIDSQIKSNGVTAVFILLLCFAYLLNTDIIHLSLFDFGELARDSATVIYTPLIEPLIAWQSEHEVLSRLLSVLLIISGAIGAMQLTIRFNLFGTVSHIPSIIYISVVVSLITPQQIIVAPLMARLMLTSLIKIYDSYTSQLSTPKIFSGCFWIGVMPLIYPPTLPLLLTFITAIIILDRGGRELFMSFVAILIPTAMLLYAMWLQRIDQSVVIQNYWRELTCGEYSLNGEIASTIYLSLAGVVTLYALSMIKSISLALVSQQRIIFTGCIFLLSLFGALFAHFDPSHLVVMAAPLAIIGTVATLQMRALWATILYVVAILFPFLIRIIPY